MRILLNGLFLIPRHVGGSETYLRALVTALASIDNQNEYILCVGPEASATFDVPNSGWRIVTSPAPSRQRPPRLALEQTWLPLLASMLKVDVIHSTGYTGPLVSTAPRITSIHDMNYRRHPEDLSRLERLVYSMLIPSVARRSDQVITVSQAARADILRWIRVPESKVDVIYHGHRDSWPGDPATDHARVASAGVTEPFVLAVAGSYPHKNIHRLLQAFPLESPHNRTTNVGLVLVGHAGRAQAAIEAAASRLPQVRLLGWVDDALLASLYRRALALAFPSLYEGFGLPLVEAMALGTPVLTSRFGAMLEIADGAAELVNPYDVDSIKTGLQRLAQDPDHRNNLRHLGLRRAADFSWERAAKQTLAAYTAAAQKT